jgi:hypothetical protein
MNTFSKRRSARTKAAASKAATLAATHAKRLVIDGGDARFAEITALMASRATYQPS